ncbi:hypothetical protein SAMN04487915_111156 [Arthrobacter sp. ov118]|nr:hypothetical protein SAMN04487915_111156 [Arthrobacter sp. ov118]
MHSLGGSRKLRSERGIVNDLTDFAGSKGATLSQLPLAWLLARKDCIVPVPDIAAADLVLTDAGLARIDEIASNGGRGGKGGLSLHPAPRPRAQRTRTRNVTLIGAH